MEIVNEFKGNRKTIKSEDENGKYQFSISGYEAPLKFGMFQISIDTEDDYAYINLYKSELIAIQKLINEALDTLK